MSDNSTIEWTDATWNPVTGCTKVSPGCDNCYAETFAERFRGTAGHYFEQGFDVVLRPDKLDQPLKWRKPRRIFVNSMSDLFHDDVSDEYIARVFAVMAATPQHTYQLLTKRHGRMRSLLNNLAWRSSVFLRESVIPGGARELPTWPLPNLWLGVSVEDQKRADLRIPALIDTPAAVRWLSMEPLLGPVDLDRTDKDALVDGGIDWVVVGGESGPGARPMHPQWARDLRDQCSAAEVPFFFKQWGEWAPNGWRAIGYLDPKRERLVGEPVDDLGHREVIQRMGKKAAGRVLDGRTWDEYPATAALAEVAR
jgi:protein gp37